MQIPEPGHDPDDAREAARRLLENTDFDPDSNPVAWLAGQRGLGAVLLVVLLVALFAVAVWYVRRRVRSEVTAEPEGPVVVLGEDVDPVQAESQLQTAITGGDHSAEVIARYRVIVVDLVQRGVLGEEVSRTTGEYVAELRAAWPQHGPAFSSATAVFEDVYYGDMVAGPEEASLVARVQGALQNRPEADVVGVAES